MRRFLLWYKWMTSWGYSFKKISIFYSLSFCTLYVKYCYCHSKIKFISSRRRVISSMNTRREISYFQATMYYFIKLLITKISDQRLPRKMFRFNIDKFLAHSALKHGKLVSKCDVIDIFTCEIYILQCKDTIFLI